MPENFTAFNNRNRDANVQYNSGSYAVPSDTEDTHVEFTITNIDLVNEPDTTIIYWTIERNEGGDWLMLAGGDFNGLNGNTPPKPPGVIGVSLAGVKGQQVRGSMYFVSANDQRKRFGVEGRTY